MLKTRSIHVKTLNAAIYIIFALIGVLNVFWPLLFNGFGVVQPDTGDTVFNAVILEHVFRSFFDLDYKGSFWSPIFFYPNSLVLTYSDNLLGAAPVYWLFRIFFDWLTAAQLWNITVVLLTYFSYIYLLRSLKIVPLLAAFLSFAFCFGILKINGIAHPQMFPQFYTPLTFVALFSFVRNPNIKLFNLILLFVFLQTLAGYYLGWFLIFSLLIFVPVYVYFSRNELLRFVVFIKLNRTSILKSIGIWALLFLSFWGLYFITSSKLKYTGMVSFISEQVPTLGTYFTPPSGSFYYKTFNLEERVYSDNHIWGYGGFLFEGLLGLIILVAGFYLYKLKDINDTDIKIAKALYATGIILHLLTFKAFNLSLWFLIYTFVPGADGIRFIGRIWYISYFYLSTAVAIYIQKSERYKKLSPFVLMLLLSILVIEQIGLKNLYTPKDSFNQLVSQVTEKVSTNSCDVFYLTPFVDPKSGTVKDADLVTYGIAAMVSSINSNIPTINGYSGFLLVNLRETLDQAGLQKVLEDKFKGTLCYINTNDTNLPVSTYVFPLE